MERPLHDLGDVLRLAAITLQTLPCCAPVALSGYCPTSCFSLPTICGIHGL
jgi:hypothetical protein